MSEAKVRGIVHLIEETKSYGQKGFRKRLVVLEQPQARFVNYIPLDFLGEACDAVDEFHVGDEIEVDYRLAGRKWQKDSASEVKFFLNAEATGFRMLHRETTGPASTEASSVLGEEASDNEVPF
ncbi:MAG TPA: DUF3127 domain-containing protein [Pirellulaceae bacterium]